MTVLAGLIGLIPGVFDAPDRSRDREGAVCVSTDHDSQSPPNGAVGTEHGIRRFCHAPAAAVMMAK